MVDINQLQIGDWVRLKYTNKYRSVDEPVRINGVLAKGCANQYGGDGTIWGEDHGNLGNGNVLFPIPLTAEILEKNGFKDYTEIYEYQFEEDGEKYRFYIKKMYEDGKFDCWGTNIGGVLPSLITSVNELQHALRLCGLNDLADDFKV